MCHKLASTTSLVQCPAASPETQKPKKDAGPKKRHILSSDSMSQFPPHYGSPKESPAQSWSLAQGSGHVCTRHTGASPWQHLPGKQSLLHRDTQECAGCGMPAPSLPPWLWSLLCGKPPVPTGTDPSIPQGFTQLQGSSGGEKKPPILPCPAAEPAMEATDDSFQKAP